jgi:hypothetical protein
MKIGARSLSAALLILVAATMSTAQVPRPAFELSKIDHQIVKRFEEAWRISGNGSFEVEGVVLVYLNADGSYRGTTLRRTNESKKTTFTWYPEIVAIVHTHPKVSYHEPASQDILLADRYGIPIFTITVRGMFMYDPRTKKTTKIKDCMDWLDPSHWPQPEQIATKQAIK